MCDIKTLFTDDSLGNHIASVHDGQNPEIQRVLCKKSDLGGWPKKSKIQKRPLDVLKTFGLAYRPAQTSFFDIKSPRRLFLIFDLRGGGVKTPKDPSTTRMLTLYQLSYLGKEICSQKIQVMKAYMNGMTFRKIFFTMK